MDTQNVQKNGNFVLRDRSKQHVVKVKGITITGATKKEAKYVVENNNKIVYEKRR